MIEMPLTQGKVALLDDCDAHFAQFKWFAQRMPTGHWYVRRNIWRDEAGKHRVLLLHREVLGVVDRSVRVDHVNGDGLDCRRANLRIASASQNVQNTRLRSDNTSGHKGVIHDRRTPPLRKPWKAVVQLHGRAVFVRRFATKEEAAQAYRDAARLHFGEFACLDR